MLAITRHGAGRRFLGAPKLNPSVYGQALTLQTPDTPGGGAPPTRFGVHGSLIFPGPGGGGGGGGTPPSPTNGLFWFAQAVGPTASPPQIGVNQPPGPGQPPAPQTPTDAAIQTVRGGGADGGQVPVPPAGGGASNTPTASEPTGTIIAPELSPVKPKWPWLVGGVVVAVGAYLFATH